MQTDAPGAEVDPLIGLSQRLRIQATEPSATDGGVKRTWPRIPKAAGVAAAFVVAAILVAAIGLRGGLPDANTQAASSPQAEGLAEQPAAAEPEPAAAAAPARMPAARGGGGSGGGRSSGRASDRYQASGDITDIFCQPREDETVEAWRARVPPYCQLTP